MVHAGRIPLTYVDPSKGRNYKSPTLSGEKGVVYFALNALTSHDMFLREVDFIVWTPLAKPVDRLINLNPYEMMLVVDIPLSSGDIIMYRKKPAEVIYSEKTRRFVSYRSPVLSFMEGNNLPDKINAGDFLNSANYERKMMDLGIKVVLIEISNSMPSNQLFSFLRESAALYLKEMGAFEVYLVDCFWRHQNSVISNGVEYPQLEFMVALVNYLGEMLTAYQSLSNGNCTYIFR